MKTKAEQRVLSVFMAFMMILSTVFGDGFTIRADAEEQTYVNIEENSDGDVSEGNVSDGNISDGNVSGGDTSDGDVSGGEDPLFLYQAGLLTQQEYQQVREGKQTAEFVQKAEGNTIAETLEALDTEGASKGSLYAWVQTAQWLPEEMSEELVLPECFGGVVLSSGARDGKVSFDDIVEYPAYELTYVTTEDQWVYRTFAQMEEGFVEFQWNEEEQKDVLLEESKIYTEEELLESVKEYRDVVFQCRVDHIAFQISSISLCDATELVFGDAWVSAAGNGDPASNRNEISVSVPEAAGQNPQIYFNNSFIAGILACSAVNEDRGVDLNFLNGNEITGFTGAANISFLGRSSEEQASYLRVFYAFETEYVKTVLQDVRIEAPTGWILLRFGKYNPSIEKQICYSCSYDDVIEEGVTRLVSFEEEKEDPQLVSYIKFENQNDGVVYLIDENGCAFRDKATSIYRGILCEKADFDKMSQGEDPDNGQYVYADSLDGIFAAFEETESSTTKKYAVVFIQNWLSDDQWEELTIPEGYQKVLFLSDEIFDEEAQEGYKASFHLTRITMENGTSAEFRADIFVDDTYDDATENSLYVETSGAITQIPVLTINHAGIGGQLNISGESPEETVKLEIVDSVHAGSIESIGEIAFRNEQEEWINLHLQSGFAVGRIGSMSMETHVGFDCTGIPGIDLGSVKDAYAERLIFEVKPEDEIQVGVTKVVAFADVATDPDAVKENLTVYDSNRDVTYGINCGGYAVELPGVYLGWIFSSAEAMEQFLTDWNGEGVTTLEEENLQELLDQIGALEDQSFVVVSVPGNEPAMPDEIRIPAAIRKLCFDMGGYEKKAEDSTDQEVVFVEREFTIGKIYPQSGSTEIILNSPVAGKEGVLQVEWPVKAAVGTLKLNHYDNPGLKKLISGTATGELAGTLSAMGELSLDFLTGFDKVMMWSDIRLTSEIQDNDERVILGDVYLENLVTFWLPEGMTIDKIPEIGSVGVDPANRYHTEEFYFDTNENHQPDGEEKFTSIVYSLKPGTVPLEERYRKTDDGYRNRRFAIKDHVLYEADEDNQILGEAENLDLDQLQRASNELSVCVYRLEEKNTQQICEVPLGTPLIKIGQCNAYLNLSSLGTPYAALSENGILQQYPHTFALYECKNKEEYEQFFGPERVPNPYAEQYFLEEKDYESVMTEEMQDLYSMYYGEIDREQHYGDDLDALLDQAGADKAAYLVISINEDISDKNYSRICFPASAQKVCIQNNAYESPFRELKLQNSDAEIYLQDLTFAPYEDDDTLQVIYADKKGTGTVTFQNISTKNTEKAIAVKVTAENMTRTEIANGSAVGTLIFRAYNEISGLSGAAKTVVYEGLNLNSLDGCFEFQELEFAGCSYVEVKHAGTSTFRVGKVISSPLENHWVQFRGEMLKPGEQLVSLKPQWGASEDTIQKLRCGVDNGRIDKEGQFTCFFHDDVLELGYDFPYIWGEEEKLQESIYLETVRLDRAFTADDFGLYQDSAGTELLGRPDELRTTDQEEGLKLELIFGRTKSEIVEGRVYLCYKENAESKPYCLAAVDVEKLIEYPYIYYVSQPQEQIYDYGTAFEEIRLPQEVEVRTQNIAVRSLPVSEWKLEGEYNPAPEETTLYSFVGQLQTDNFQCMDGLDTKIRMSVRIQGKPYAVPAVTTGLVPGCHTEQEFRTGSATISVKEGGFWFTTDGSDPRNSESDRTWVVNSLEFTGSYLKGKTIRAYTPGDGQHMESDVAEFSWRAIYDDLALSVVVIEDQEYTGAAIKPVVEVYDKTTRLSQGKHYTVSYKNNVNVASREAQKAPTAIIKGKGAYAGTLAVTFNIVPKTEVEVSAKEYLTVTTGKGGKRADLKKASVVAKAGKKTLKAGKDYDISYQNPLGEPLDHTTVAYEGTESTYYVVVTGKGNYSFERILAVRIGEKEDLSKARITLKTKKVFFEGPWSEEHKTGFVLKIGKNTYVSGTEEFDKYFVADYQDYAEPGTAKLLIRAKNDSPYGGVVATSYSIEKRKLSTAGFDSKGRIADQKYTGEAITLVNGLDGDYYLYREIDANGEIRKEALSEGTDYEVTYLNNLNAGTATVLFTALDSGIYTGTVKKTFKITKAELAKKNASKKTMELGKDFIIQIEDTYSGDYTILKDAGKDNGRRLGIFYEPGGVMPLVSVMYGDLLLTEGKDYKVVYKNHKAVSTRDASGKIKKCGVITITGIGNYQGTLTGKVDETDGLTFWVQPCDISIVDLELAVSDAVYKKGNTFYKPGVVASIDDAKLKGNTDYTVTYIDNTNAGIEIDDATGLPGKIVTRKLVVSGKGNYTGTIEGVYRIVPQTFDKLVFSIDKQVFEGGEVTLSAEDIHIKVNKKAAKELVLGEDYIIVGYEKNQAAGTAKVLLKGTGLYPGTKKVSFTIVKPKK